MKPLVGSYTLLNTYDICPHQAFRRFVVKDIPFVETPAMKHGTEVHTGMERRIKNGTVAYREYEPFAEAFLRAEVSFRTAEMKVGMRRDGDACDFFDKDVWFRGKIDVVLAGATHGFIGDWKTGKTREDPDELELFSLMLKSRMPQLTKVTGVYVWLKEMKLGKIHDLSDFAGKFRSLVSRMDEIEQAKKMDWWPKQQGPLCNWCSVLDCEFNKNQGKT